MKTLVKNLAVILALLLISRAQTSGRFDISETSDDDIDDFIGALTGYRPRAPMPIAPEFFEEEFICKLREMFFDLDRYHFRVSAMLGNGFVTIKVVDIYGMHVIEIYDDNNNLLERFEDESSYRIIKLDYCKSRYEFVMYSPQLPRPVYSILDGDLTHR